MPYATENRPYGFYRTYSHIEGGNPSAPAGHLPLHKGGFGAYLVDSAHGGRFVNRPYGEIRTACTQPPARRIVNQVQHFF